MKKTLSIIFLLALSFTVYCQTSHTVSSGSYYYYPSTLTISVGDTVHWVNDGGLHNVNFDNNSITGASFNNPESFISSPTTAYNMYTHVFNIAGTYDYDCSVGSHAASGMVGTIIVNGTSSTIFSSSKNKTLRNMYNLYGQEISKTPHGFVLLRYKDGSIEKKYILK